MEFIFINPVTLTIHTLQICVDLARQCDRMHIGKSRQFSHTGDSYFEGFAGSDLAWQCDQMQICKSVTLTIHIFQLWLFFSSQTQLLQNHSFFCKIFLLITKHNITEKVYIRFKDVHKLHRDNKLLITNYLMLTLTWRPNVSTLFLPRSVLTSF